MGEKGANKVGEKGNLAEKINADTQSSKKV